MANGVWLITAVADSIRSYGEFPVIGARAAVWIAAEVHLMFAAFVLGVPMFAVVAEAIGIVTKDARYDRLSRSEEHTSELQSPDHLVCRLLLEKKKNKTRTTNVNIL